MTHYHSSLESLADDARRAVHDWTTRIARGEPIELVVSGERMAGVLVRLQALVETARAMGRTG